MDSVRFIRVCETIDCLKILREFSDSLNSLQNRTQDELLLYAEKFAKYGNVIVARNGLNDTMGFIAYYANDNLSKISFISMLAVHPQYRKKRIGSALIDCCISDCINKGMNTLKLEVAKVNLPAQLFYKKKGFSEIESASDKSVFWGRSI